MELGHRLDINHTLEMMLSPNMIQMLKLLNMSYVELVEEIDKVSEENVMLEIEHPDRLVEYIKYISSERIPKKDITGEELPGMETLADTEETLEEHMLKQLDMEDTFDDKQRKIAEILISSIDGRGYLQHYEKVSASITKDTGASQKEIDDVLAVIQGFDPEGIAARNVKECLLIQVKAYNFESEDLEDVLTRTIEKHLEDLAEKNFDKIAKDLGITRSGVENLAKFIKNNLNPIPGSLYAEKLPCIIPSFSIKKEKDKYKAVNLERTYGPVLGLNPTYEKMLKDPKTDAETITFLKGKLQAAKDFIEHVYKRHETIEKIMDVIIKTQSAYLDGGPLNLCPLMQKNIAEEFGVHPSTISRAIASKYIQTPKGLLLLKHLCPREVKGQTKEKIKKLIEDIITSEDKNSPLMDDEIMEKLKPSGIFIERRTVASYRNELGSDIASRRKNKK